MQTVKLIVLGEQSTGKTTLTRTLASGKCQTRDDDCDVTKDYLSATERSSLMKRLPRDSMIEGIEDPNRYNICHILYL